MFIRPERTVVVLAVSILLIAGTAIAFFFAQPEPEVSAEPLAAKQLRCPNAESGVTGMSIEGPPIDDPRWNVLTPEQRAGSPREIVPRFTVEAWDACVSGVVVMELLLEAQGKVQDGRVLKGLPYGLDRRAAEAVIHEVFEPARIGREPVPSRHTVVIRFDPNNDKQRPE